MSSSGREQHEGFDRSRILEWLQSVDTYHQPSSAELEEVDEGSNFDSEEPPPVTPKPPPPLQQQQQQQQIQRLHNLSPFIQRRSRSPTNNMGAAPAQRTESSANSPHPVVERACIASSTDVTFSQSHTHLRSLHSRKKSESPLPEVTGDSQLPVFDPKTPALPGNRAPRLSLKSEAGGSPRHSPQVLIHARPGLGSVTLSCPALQVPEISPPPLYQSLRSPSPLTSRYPVVGRHSSEGEIKPIQRSGNQTQDDRGGAGEEQKILASVPTSHDHPEANSLPKTSKVDSITASSKDSPPPPPRPLPQPGHDQPTSVLEPQLQSTPVAPPYNMSLMTDTLPETLVEKSDSLSSVELAVISLKVIDILPQLAVYLGVEYRDYEDVVASEPSPQRQSMSILMKWYRSGTGGSKQSLAQALQQFGQQYSRLAQSLLRGELEESRQQLLSEDTLQTQKPTPSPSPAPLSHPPPPPTHPSPGHKHHHARPSPSPSPSSILSPQSRKLKAGFTFDEDRHSSDSLPKFLATRSLFTNSPDSPLVSGSHAPQCVQRHLSLSDISSSSWPAASQTNQGDSAYSCRRKSSLPHDDPVEFSGRGYSKGRRGSSERVTHSGSGWRKSSLHSDEILMSLTEYDRDIPTNVSPRALERGETVVRMRAGGSGSLDLGCGRNLGAWAEGMRAGDPTSAPHRYQIIGSRTGVAAPGREFLHHRSSLGSRPLGGLGSWGRRELSASTSGHKNTGPGNSSPSGVAGTSRRAIDRRDSGIETLASNLSTLH